MKKLIKSTKQAYGAFEDALKAKGIEYKKISADGYDKYEYISSEGKKIEALAGNVMQVAEDAWSEEICFYEVK